MLNIKKSKVKIQNFILRNSPYTRKLIYEVAEKEKNIYLTFDDGPNPGTTEFIIDQLNRYNAKATFFCIGNNIEKHPDTYRLYIENGHSIGNHTYDHLKGWKTDNATYYDNIIKCNNAIINQESANQQISKSANQMLRPPYGKIKFSQIAHLRKEYRIYMWTTISYDFDRNTSEEKCLKNVLDNTKEGSIVVFHDSNKASKNLFYALPRVLEYFSEKGFFFKALI